MNYRVIPPDGMLEARVRLPLSKSISNRLLIIHALTDNAGPLPVLADAADTRVMAEALGSDAAEVNVDGAGTAMRFLTALYAATPGRQVTIDGNGRMRQRPIGPLVDALRKLGADIEYTGQEGFPPLVIKGRRLRGGTVKVDAGVSSQFVSALLMVAPTMESPVTFDLEGEAVSMPYIKMTTSMMEACGVECRYEEYRIIVEPGHYKPVETVVEGDWSAASYWYEIAALSAGFITLDGLTRDSVQGDRHIADIFKSFCVDTLWEGEEGGIDLQLTPDQAPRLVMDLTDYPDLVPSIVVTAVMLGVPFRLSGLGSLRIKECDRLEALVDEMHKIGAELKVENDVLSWELERHPIGEMPWFATHGDHRMAMALAPVSIFIPGIVVEDAEVVEKSYPGYWQALTDVGFSLLDGDAPMPEINNAED